MGMGVIPGLPSTLAVFRQGKPASWKMDVPWGGRTHHVSRESWRHPCHPPYPLASWACLRQQCSQYMACTISGTDALSLCWALKLSLGQLALCAHDSSFVLPTCLGPESGEAWMTHTWQPWEYLACVHPLSENPHLRALTKYNVYAGLYFDTCLWNPPVTVLFNFLWG